MQRAPLDLNLLLAFEALFQERSVTAAARRLGIGQSGMSAALARLRIHLRDELFVRVRGEMRPTAKAAELGPGIAAALAQLRRTLETGLAFDPATATRSFAIGSTDYTTLVVLPPLMAHLRTHAPNVALRVLGYDKDTIPERLDRGELDIVLGVFPDPPERAVVRPLFEERFVGLVRAAHPALEAGGIDLQRFAALSHALVTNRRDATGALDEVLVGHGLRRRVALTLPYALALPSILAASDLVAAVPSRLAARMGQDAALRCFDLPIATAPWTVAMLWPPVARTDPAAAWLRETVAACAAAA